MKKRIALLALCLALCLLCGCVAYNEPTGVISTRDRYGKIYRIDFGNHSIQYNGINYPYIVGNEGTVDPTVTIRYPNGATYYANSERSGGNGTVDDRYAPGQILVDLVRPSYTGRPTGPHVLNYIALILGIGIGVLSICRPRAVWEWENMLRRWEYNDPEPSQMGLDKTRLGGVISIIAGLILFFYKWN